MTTRVRAVLLGGLALIAVLVVAGVGLLASSDLPARVTAPAVASLAPDARTSDDFAQAACVRLRLAAQGITAGGAADAVRTELAAARALAAEALRQDGRYAPLSGGLAALDEALRRDDPGAASAGLRVALDACGSS